MKKVYDIHDKVRVSACKKEENSQEKQKD